jgi:hypothetical protein
LNYINETRKAIEVGNSTAALTNLDLAERQLSLLIGGSNSSSSSIGRIGGLLIRAGAPIPAEEGQQLQEQSLLEEANISPPENQAAAAATPSIQTPSAVIVEELEN